MHPEEFGPASPGRLVPVEFHDDDPESGRVGVAASTGMSFVPDPLPPVSLSRVALLDALHDRIVAAERALSELEGATQQLRNPHLLIGPFLMREARLSSIIENTFTSARQLALFDFDPSAVENRDQVREVSNYRRALEYGLDSELPICLRLIREMHSVLMRGVPTAAKRIGDFRISQNAIGPTRRFADAKYVPPPAPEMTRCLHDFETYLNRPDDWPRLVRFALTHYQFEAIHPFDDGNGRLGRLLIVLQLCKQAQMTRPTLYVSGYFEAHRSEYYQLLYEVSARGAWIDWIEFFLRAIETQARDALDRTRRIFDLNQKYQALVQQKRASALLPKLVDQLFVRPAITVARAAADTDVTPTAAAKAVRRLVELGILTEATGRAKNRIYVAPEIIDIIES